LNTLAFADIEGKRKLNYQRLVLFTGRNKKRINGWSAQLVEKSPCNERTSRFNLFTQLIVVA